MIFKNFNKTIDNCWWCGSHNLTGEHKFKATDLTSIFGKWHETKGCSPILIKNEKALPLQSPKSDRLKFNRCICADCNGNKSSSFDSSYTLFISFILKNRYEIFKNGCISLDEVYSSDFKLHYLNLLRYFCKQLACQASTAFYEVSPDIINFINGETDYLNDVKFFFELRTQNYILEELQNFKTFRVLYLGKFQYKQSEPLLKKICVESLTGWYTISFISINYHYEKNCAQKSNIQSILSTKKIPLHRTPVEDINSELGKENIMEIIPNLENKGRGEDIDTFLNFVQKIKNSR